MGTYGDQEISEVHQIPDQKTAFPESGAGIAQDMNPNLRFKADAIFAIQEVSEVFLVNRFEDSNLCTIHQGRITIMPRDLNLVMKLRERMGDPVAFAKHGT